MLVWHHELTGVCVKRSFVFFASSLNVAQLTDGVSRRPSFTVGWCMDTLIRYCWVLFWVSRQSKHLVYLMGEMRIFSCSKIVWNGVRKSCQRAQPFSALVLSALMSRPRPAHKHNLRHCALYLGEKRTDGAAALGQTVFHTQCFPAELRVLAASWKRAVIVPLACCCWDIEQLTFNWLVFNISSCWEYFDRWRFCTKLPAFQHAQCNWYTTIVFFFFVCVCCQMINRD